MMTIKYIYKAVRKIVDMIANHIDHFRTYIIMKGNSVHFSSFHTNGVPYVMVALGGG